MKSSTLRILLVLLALVLLCIYIWLSTKPKLTPEVGHGHNRTFVVKLVAPVIKPMPVTLQQVGSVEAEQTVNILPQASGVLRNIGFTPGRRVKQGQLLFELDPGVYATSVEQARANLARDQAQLSLLQATANRFANLAQLEYVTQQQYEEAKSAAVAQAAVVASDQALLKQAEIQLGYTQILAPISGKTSTINVHIGDLISANSSSPLVVINKLDPVWVNFAVPQAQLAEVRQYRRQNTLKVEIFAEGSEQILGQGQLVVINNVVNAQTGTVQFKARVPNPQRSLWPGQLVSVRLILSTQPNALVIPTSAVQIGQQGNFVYRVQEGKAMAQPIKISLEAQGEVVVSQGLQPGESVIVEVPVGLRAGSKVQ